MEEKTWNRLKEEWPVIFTAAAVSMLASYFSWNLGIPILSEEFFKVFGNIIISSSIAVGIFYLFLFLIYKIT